MMVPHNWVLIGVIMAGLVIGSFLAACVYRIPRGISFVWPRSHCTECGHILKSADLVPLFSYIFNLGCCKYCKTRISLKYPMMELVTAFIFSVLYLRYDITLAFFKSIILLSFLLVIAVIDWETKEIHDSVTLVLMVFGVFFGASENRWMDMLWGFLFCGTISVFLAIASKGGLGGGDVKLIAVLGVWFGWKLSLVLIALSFWIALVLAIPILCKKGRKALKETIPFAPSISIATAIVSLLSKDIQSFLNWGL